MQLTEGEVVDGRYRVAEKLGSGAMGVIHRATDVHLERSVALKVIAPEFSLDPSMRERFRREAAALAAVRSDHVVGIFTLGFHKDAMYFAMEFVRGRNLEQIIAEHEAHGSVVTLTRALTILRQSAGAIGAVHAAGLVHRDVKPANVVVEEETGRPVLVDFGLARRFDRQVGRKTAGVGTPMYMPPEQGGQDVDESRVTPRADVYSFACSAFELLTGRPPFLSEDIDRMAYQHAYEAPPAPSSIRPELARFDAAIARALAKDPLDRFPSALAFVDALEAGTSTPTLSTRGSSPAFGAPAPTSALRVLVVDDDEPFRKLAALASMKALTPHKPVIEVASSGREAVAAMAHGAPALVLLDYQMPGLDGSETLAQLRRLPGGSDMRVVVISAAAKLPRWRFSALGVRDFVAKPIDFPSLTATLRAIAERAGWVGRDDA